MALRNAFGALALDATVTAIKTWLEARTGAKTTANSISVNIANDQTVPVSGSVSISGTPAVTGPLTDTQLRATAVPVSGTFWQATQPVSGPLTDVQLRATALPVSGTFWQATQPISGSVSITGTAAVSGPLTDTQLRATAVPVSGTFWQATQPVSGTVTANAGTNLNTSALALETGGNLAAINSKVPALGQAAMAASRPVVIASNQTAIPTVEAATVITGAAAQTATVNNILPAASGAAATDTSNFRTATVQVVSTGTGGTFIFEQSNDNVNFVALPVFNALLVTGVPITAAITATASQIIYTFPVRGQFTRLRIASTITGGSIQAFTRLSNDPWTAAAQLVASNTAANLAATVSGTVTSNIGTGTVAAVTSANLALPGIIADVASAALTTTTTTAAFTPTFGTSYSVSIPVTAVSGTTPTLDVAIEESDDSGTNWFKVYDFPRITGSGMYRSPLIRIVGNRVRYVQTVGGTSPSFTRAINRLQNSNSSEAVRQLIDRSIVLTTLNSTTPSLDTRDAGNRAQLVVNVGAITTTAPALQMEGSDDNGASWYAIGTPLTAVASSTVQLTVQDINAALMRVRVSTAGSGVTAGYVMIKAHD